MSDNKQFSDLSIALLARYIDCNRSQLQQEQQQEQQQEGPKQQRAASVSGPYRRRLASSEKGSSLRALNSEQDPEKARKVSGIDTPLSPSQPGEHPALRKLSLAKSVSFPLVQSTRTHPCCFTKFN